MNSDDAWKAFEQVILWVRYADAKATTLLAANGVLGGILLSRPLSAGDAKLARNVLLTVGLCAAALSALLSVRAMVPRLLRRAPQTSMLYFDHIASRDGNDRDGYLAVFQATNNDPELMIREIVGQIWANSLVAKRKFRNVSAATWLIGLALVSGGTSVFLERV